MTEQDNGRITKADRVVVGAYLTAVRAPKQRGRQRTLESAEAELADVTTQLDADPSATTALLLTQRRIDLEREVEERRARANPGALEAEFVKVAARYGESRGISYAAWREVGVPAAVLRQAGIPETRAARR